MEDGTQLELTEKRLRNFARKKTLLELTTQRIVENISFFSKKNKQFSSLPAHLREKLLHKLTDFKCATDAGDMAEFKRRLNAFKNLLCLGMKKVKLDGLMTFCPEPLKLEQITKVVKLIATYATNIKSLTINEIRGKTGFSYTYDVSLGRDILKAIGELKELRKLELLNLNIAYSELKTICAKTLPNLEYIYCSQIIYDLEGDPKDDEENFRMSFLNLRYFFFDDVLPFTQKLGHFLNKDFVHLSVKHLPKLEVVEEYFDNDTKNVAPHCYGFPVLPKHISALRHLNACPSAFGLHLKFPDVTHLTIDFFYWDHDKRNIADFFKFNKIQGLHLYNAPSSHIVYRFLKKYGQNLQYLILTDNDAIKIQIKFRLIFKLCPKLQRLRLTFIDMIDDWRPIQFFSELKEFSWTPLGTACLSNILSAPLLDKVVFGRILFDSDDLKIVSTMILEKKILKRLSTLHFDCCSTDYELDPTDPDDSAIIRELGNMMKNALAFLPGLSDVNALFCSTRKSPKIDSPYIPDFSILGLKMIADDELINMLIAFKRSMLILPSKSNS
ncbi:Hypothetical predicted protein [Cloeon dipterum]|uniref:Uncharacterized protein n=3 Tax=Cloeon dipterum TaxID=197152 RepID=A0A8S1E4F8_9INSE|nr:Hypothetical predicted protein [Cloeon dipterum]